jgi:nucleoside 2-deoxyribosyltransferase
MRELNVYLAGPVREMGRVLRQAERLMASPGVRIVDEWWLRHDGSDERYTIEQQRTITAITVSRIEGASVLWALWPETTSHGTAWEVGYFTRYSPHGILIITGRTASSCAFTARADLRDTSDDIGFHEVLRLVREINP